MTGLQRIDATQLHCVKQTHTGNFGCLAKDIYMLTQRHASRCTAAEHPTPSVSAFRAVHSARHQNQQTSKD